MGSTIFMCIEPLIIHYFWIFCRLLVQGPLFCPKKTSAFTSYSIFADKTAFISIVDPENISQVILPPETTLLPYREGNAKTCWSQKKVAKLGNFLCQGRKCHSITPWSSFLRYNNWPCPCLKTSKPKYLLLTLGLGIEPYGCKIGKM